MEARRRKEADLVLLADETEIKIETESDVVIRDAAAVRDHVDAVRVRVRDHVDTAAAAAVGHRRKGEARSQMHSLGLQLILHRSCNNRWCSSIRRR